MIDKYHYCLASQLLKQQHPTGAWGSAFTELKEVEQHFQVNTKKAQAFPNWVLFLIHETRIMASGWTTEKDKVDCFIHTSVFSPSTTNINLYYLKYPHFIFQNSVLFLNTFIHSNWSNRTFLYYLKLFTVNKQVLISHFLSYPITNISNVIISDSLHITVIY